MGRGVLVGHNAVAMLMHRAGLKGLPGNKRPRSRQEAPTAEDLVDRAFARTGPDELWVTDITEHPTREGKVYCAVVLDAFSRRVVGWSIDTSPSASLATNSLGMAIQGRRPSGTLIHSVHGTQFTSWAFTERAKRSGLLPSMGSIGDCFDNAVVESFWARMQVELLYRRRWRTRVELANAIFEHLEIFHNRQRRQLPRDAHPDRVRRRWMRTRWKWHEVKRTDSTKTRGTSESLANPGRFISESQAGSLPAAQGGPREQIITCGGRNSHLGEIRA